MKLRLLQKGCEVFMKKSSGCFACANLQCVRAVDKKLLEIYLYGHFIPFKMEDIKKIVTCPKN